MAQHKPGRQREGRTDYRPVTSPRCMSQDPRRSAVEDCGGGARGARGRQYWAEGSEHRPSHRLVVSQEAQQQITGREREGEKRRRPLLGLREGPVRKRLARRRGAARRGALALDAAALSEGCGALTSTAALAPRARTFTFVLASRVRPGTRVRAGRQGKARRTASDRDHFSPVMCERRRWCRVRQRRRLTVPSPIPSPSKKNDFFVSFSRRQWPDTRIP